MRHRAATSRAELPVSREGADAAYRRRRARPECHVVRELEERGPGWNLARRRDLGIVDRTEERGEERRRLRRIPGRERNERLLLRRGLARARPRRCPARLCAG